MNTLGTCDSMVLYKVNPLLLTKVIHLESNKSESMKSLGRGLDTLTGTWDCGHALDIE